MLTTEKIGDSLAAAERLGVREIRVRSGIQNFGLIDFVHDAKVAALSAKSISVWI
jgi:hypothetical protein